MKADTPIKVRMNVTFILILIVFASFLIAFNYNSSLKNSYELSNQIMDQAAKSVIEKTKFYLTKSNTSLKILINNNKTFNIYDNHIINREIMWEMLLSEDHISSVFLADKYANFFQVRRNPALAMRSIESINGNRVDFYEYKDKQDVTLGYESFLAEYDPTLRTWYKETLNKEIIISKPYIFASTKKLGITVSYAGVDEYNNKLATGGVDITLDTLKKFIDIQAKGIKGDIYLFNKEFNIIVSSKGELNEYFLKGKKIDKNDFVYFKLQELFNQNKLTGLLSNNGEEFIYDMKKMKVDENNEWGVAVVISEDIILGSSKEVLYSTVIVSLVFLVFFILLSTKVSKMISQPIVKLANDIDALKKLQTDNQLSSDSRITEIYQAQNALISLQKGIISFKKYMPSDLVKILIDKKQEAKIGGVEKDLAVMFTDIEGFTTISEKMDPLDITEHLSIYFYEMEQVISQYNGTIDKYIGDAIMAFWGAPLDIDKPLVKVVTCAIDMQKKLDVLNKQWEKDGKPVLKTRIGIHFGKTLVGNIGSPNRMNYTIIGDTVNIASRLESINKKYGTKIMLSQNVVEHVEHDFSFVYIDEIELKGKTKPTKIFTIKQEVS